MKTLVTFLLDRTGSMASIKDDTIGGFNTYLKTLKEDGAEIDFTLLQFDSQSVDKVHVKTPVKDVPELTNETFQPRASTPLIDAAYETIKAVEESKPEGKIVVCIQTDGQENASTKHTWAELKLLIEEKTVLGWQFNFMGASIDSYSTGAKMGLSRDATISYDSADPHATRAAFAASARNTQSFARGESLNTLYSEKQRADFGDKFDPKAKEVKKLEPKAIVDKISL